jgi:predicted RNA-binding Zn-ribbon protein involved in translation (DUF1610 family)
MLVGSIVLTLAFGAIAWAIYRTSALVRRRERWWISEFACDRCGYRNAVIIQGDPERSIECPECSRTTIMRRKAATASGPREG